MRFFIGGSLSKIDSERRGDAEKFVNALVDEILNRGHNIYVGCRGGIDEFVARVAQDRLGDEVEQRLTSYHQEHEPPVHNVPNIFPSRIGDWGLAQDDLRVPEQIAKSDLAIIIGGTDGTYTAANWARIEGKPLIGVARYSGAGGEVYRIEMALFDEKYAHLVDADEFEKLGSLSGSAEKLAKRVVTVSERMLPRNVFPVMSFDPSYDILFDLWVKVCSANGYSCERTDRVPTTEAITPRILKGIRRAPFVLADISEISLNVFFEVGYASGLRREVILTSRNDHDELPFDLKDLPVTHWDADDLASLEPKLDGMIKQIKARFRKRRKAGVGLRF